MKQSLKYLIIFPLVFGFHLGRATPVMAIVDPPVDVVLTKEVNVSQAETGELVTYTLTVTCKIDSLNNCVPVVVSDNLPPELTVQSVDAPADYNCENTATTVDCIRSQTLIKGNFDVITVIAKVNEGVDDESVLANFASVTGNSAETNPDDNTDSVEFEVITCGNNQLAFSEDCDDGNTSDGDCCTSQCTFDPEGTPCDDGASFGQGSCDGFGFCETADLTANDVIANGCQLHHFDSKPTYLWIMMLPLAIYATLRLGH